MEGSGSVPAKQYAAQMGRRRASQTSGQPASPVLFVDDSGDRPLTLSEPALKHCSTMEAINARQDPDALLGLRIMIEGRGEGLVTGVRKKPGKTTQHLVAFHNHLAAGAQPVLLQKKMGGKGSKFYIMLDGQKMPAGAALPAASKEATTVTPAPAPPPLPPPMPGSHAHAAAMGSSPSSPKPKAPPPPPPPPLAAAGGPEAADFALYGAGAVNRAQGRRSISGPPGKRASLVGGGRGGRAAAKRASKSRASITSKRMSTAALVPPGGGGGAPMEPQGQSMDAFLSGAAAEPEQQEQAEAAGMAGGGTGVWGRIKQAKRRSITAMTAPSSALSAEAAEEPGLEQGAQQEREEQPPADAAAAPGVWGRIKQAKRRSITAFSSAPSAEAVGETTTTGNSSSSSSSSGSSSAGGAPPALPPKPTSKRPSALPVSMMRSPVLHTCRLEKKGGFRKNWNFRFFVLRGDAELEYYNSAEDATDDDALPKGTFTVTAFMDVPDRGGHRRNHRVDLFDDGPVGCLQTPDRRGSAGARGGGSGRVLLSVAATTQEQKSALLEQLGTIAEERTFLAVGVAEQEDTDSTMVGGVHGALAPRQLKDEQLAEKDRLLAAQAARIAALEAAAAGGPPAAAPLRGSKLGFGKASRAAHGGFGPAHHAHAGSSSSSPARPGMKGNAWPSAKHVHKVEKERAFNDSLEPRLRVWMGEAPAMTGAALLADKDTVLRLEASIASPAGRAKIAKLAPAIADRIRDTVVPYMGEEQMKRLRAICEAGNELYFGMYINILMKQVRNNDGFHEFCGALDAVKLDGSRYPQRMKDLAGVYGAAHEAFPLYGAVLDDLAKRAKRANCAGKVITRAAPLKHVFRVLQKHATRVDGGGPTEFETACDIVRGSVVCESMGDLLIVLRLLVKLQKERKIKIARVKNRFKQPTAAGWADAMVNFVCLGGGSAASGHVCELQLIHMTMLKARKEFGGHNAYAAFREAAELLDFIVGGVLAGAVETAVLALTAAAEEASEAADGAGDHDEEAVAAGDALVKRARALVPAVDAAMVPLQRARAIVPEGGDAAQAAEPWLTTPAIAAAHARIATAEEVLESKKTQKAVPESQWVRAGTCQLCGKAFGTMGRGRQHCRRCGECVCVGCSPFKLEVRGAGKQRACLGCAALEHVLEFKFYQTGGEAKECAKLTENSTLFRIAKEPGMYCHAATGIVGSCTMRVAIPEDGDTKFLYLGLAAARKDLFKDYIYDDGDVWLMQCNGGYLFAGGARRDGAGTSPQAGDVLDIEFDAEACTLRFLRDGELLGEHTEVAPAAKFVVSMGSKGSALSLVGCNGLKVES